MYFKHEGKLALKIEVCIILLFTSLFFFEAVPSVLGLNESSAEISSSGTISYSDIPFPSEPPASTYVPPQGDYSVYQEGGLYKVGGRVATFSSDSALVAINYAINALSSGTISIQPGVYPIGGDTIITGDSPWVSAASSVSIENGASGMEGIAAQINIPYPAPTGLVAHCNFPIPIDLSGNSLGFWFRPSVDLSNKATTGDYGGSPLKILLSTSPNCATPIYSVELWHPEWITATWKYYKIPFTPTSGTTLPAGLTNIRSIGIEIWNNSQCITPTVPYNVLIDDVHANSGYLTLHGNIQLMGAGSLNTLFVLNAAANVPLITIGGSNVEIAGLQLDGNLANQGAIDGCPGIYDPGFSGISIHHNYIHHTKGAGIKLRGTNIAIYENLIEWTENPNIELSYSPSFVHIYYNTLKYVTNDDNVRISGGAHDNTVEFNLLYGASGAAWNGIKLDHDNYNNFIQCNKIFNVPGCGIIQGCGHDNTIQFNEIYYSAQDQLSVQSWGGLAENIHVYKNFIVGGAQKGINIGGTNVELIDNWSKDNALGGLFVGGSGAYGRGNYAEESTNNAPAGLLSATPPNLQSFQAGVTW
jgi:hypothetical protein